MTNIFDDLPMHMPKEVVQTLMQAADVRIERIISHGHASPAEFWYDQPQHEWVIVLKGAARLQFEDRTVEMKPGDFVNIPARQKHRVEGSQQTRTSCCWPATAFSSRRLPMKHQGQITSEITSTERIMSESSKLPQHRHEAKGPKRRSSYWLATKKKRLATSQPLTTIQITSELLKFYPPTENRQILAIYDTESGYATFSIFDG